MPSDACHTAYICRKRPQVAHYSTYVQAEIVNGAHRPHVEVGIARVVEEPRDVSLARGVDEGRLVSHANNVVLDSVQRHSGTAAQRYSGTAAESRNTDGKRQREAGGQHGSTRIDPPSGIARP